MTATTFTKSQAMALKLGSAAHTLFCTFGYYNGQKMPYQRGGKKGVPAVISNEALFTAGDIYGMAAIEHGQFFGLNMNKPIIIEGKGHLVCLDVDIKNKSKGDPVDPAIKNLESWVNKVGALNELSVSGKGHHVFIIAKSADNILRKYTLAQGQEIEIFGLPSSDKKSILLTGENMEGEIPVVDDLETFLINLGISKEKAAPKPKGNLDAILNPFPALALRANQEAIKEPLHAQALHYLNDPQTTLGKAAEALNCISPDGNYDMWIKVGQALHDGFGEQGRALWGNWSQGGKKYKGQGDIDTHWKSFHQGGGIGIGTLFHLAKEGGYQMPNGVAYQSAQANFQGLKIDSKTGEVVNHPLAVFVDCDGKAKPPRWVIPGFIGHGVTVISGGHGVGKTTALLPLAMTAAGLHGNELMPSHWRHVVYVSEDIEQAKRILAGIVLHGKLDIDPETVKERLHLVEAVRLDPAFVAMVGVTYKSQFTRTVGGVKILPLVVIDTKSAVFAIDDENHNSEASKMMAALKQGFNGLPVWLVGHIAKASMASTEGLTSRGASAIEADANQTLYLINEKGRRYFKQGKTRFEPKWQELDIEGCTFGGVEIDEFGNSEVVTLRWGVASPALHNSKEAKELANEAEKKIKMENTRHGVITAVTTGWNLGNPHSKTSLRNAVGGNTKEVTRAIEALLHEKWLHEIQVPSNERLVNSRSAFFVCLTKHEHDLLLAGASVPQKYQIIPASWRKAPISPVPVVLENFRLSEVSAQS